MEKFALSVTQSGLHKHLVQKCGLTMKKLEKISEARNSPETIQARYEWVYAFQQTGIDFQKCVFIDEAGFNMHMKRTFGRSKKGVSLKHFELQLTFFFIRNPGEGNYP